MSMLFLGLVIFYGTLCMLSAFAASRLGGILQLAISVLSLAGAPLLVVFTLGVLIPFANKWVITYRVEEKCVKNK